MHLILSDSETGQPEEDYMYKIETEKMRRERTRGTNACQLQQKT
jgi:hypothetical protein